MRPGVNVTNRAAAPPRGAPTDTGTVFVAGISPKGPTDRAVLVRNMSEFSDVFGARVGVTALLYDAVETMMMEGATRIYVGRVVGPGAAVDTVTLDDAGAADSLAVDAIGEYDSDLTVEVVAGDGAGQFRLVIADGGTEVERSPNLDDVADAVAWGTQSDYVRVRALGENDPAVVGATALAGGDDDRANITDAERTAALDVFESTLGPGQVAYPGATTEAMHTALLGHAETHNRHALLDATDTNVLVTLDTQADAQRAAAVDPSYGSLFGPWVVVPGVIRNTTRTVPPSALVAGLIARSDQGGSANVPAAGVNGEARWALGLTQSWSDADHETLNETGVNVIKEVYGGVRLYGYRTLADPDEAPEYLGIGNSRLRMQITAEADGIGEQFMFAQLDGRGIKIAEFGGALAGMLQRYYTLGSLYGETSGDAFRVDVGATVNTPATIENGELRAVLAVRMSPFAEMTTIEIVKVPITQPV